MLRKLFVVIFISYVHSLDRIVDRKLLENLEKIAKWKGYVKVKGKMLCQGEPANKAEVVLLDEGA